MALRKGILAAACILALLAVFGLVWSWRGGPADNDDKKPKIAVLSSISLQWGEAGLDEIAKGRAKPDPLVARLSQYGDPIFVDSIAALQAAQPDIAILIQPRPFSPDELVRLDNWVRAGGRLLLFADPALQWPTELPFGDPQRPLFTSMLSPILAHWGLELALPMTSEAGPVDAEYGGMRIEFVSPGIWTGVDGRVATGSCRIDPMIQLAECRPGKGQVLLVADADLLQSQVWQSGVPRIDRNDNIEWTGRLIKALGEGERIVAVTGK